MANDKKATDKDRTQLVPTPVAAGPPVDREEARDGAFLLAALAEDGMPISAGGPGPTPSVSVRPPARPPTATVGPQVRSGSLPTD